MNTQNNLLTLLNKNLVRCGYGEIHSFKNLNFDEKLIIAGLLDDCFGIYLLTDISNDDLKVYKIKNTYICVEFEGVGVDWGIKNVKLLDKEELRAIYKSCISSLENRIKYTLKDIKSLKNKLNKI